MATQFQGTKGRPFRALTNSFAITQLPTVPFTQYDVIQPETKIPRQRIEIMEKLQNDIAPAAFSPRALYDGRSLLYTSGDLERTGGTGRFEVYLGRGTPRPNSTRGVFTVQITRTSGARITVANLNGLITGSGQSTSQTATAINLLQILIRQAPDKKYPSNGRAYFTSVNSRAIGGGFELWKGYFLSVRPTIGRMLVNIDLSTSAVHKSGPLEESFLEVLGSRNIRDLSKPENSDSFRILKSHFKNVQISVKTIAGRTKVIHGIVPAAGWYRFEKDGQETTVAEYYLRAHGIKLKYPEAFGVRLTPRKAPQEVIVPAEVCRVLPGQLYKKKLPQQLTQKMVDFSVLKPSDRLAGIMSGNVEAPAVSFKSSSQMASAGMAISEQALTIDGRVLATPRVVYGSGSVEPKYGMWNVVNQRLARCARLEAWGLVNFEPSVLQPVVRAFIELLMRCCETLGMSVTPPGFVGNGNGQVGAVERDFKNAGDQIMKTSPRPLLILAILPKSAADIRQQIKLLGDVRFGVATQCIRSDKLSRLTDQYANNVALKINGRLGGYNSTVTAPSMDKLKQAPYMIMGADVGHPGPGMANRPSVTSLVWSHDEHAVEYVAYSSVQNPRSEIIEDLKGMVMAAIDGFGTKNKIGPARIIFFRDGVSEGEYEKVSKQEIAEVKSAFDAVWQKNNVNAPKPKLTFVVVGKRHHIRFFPRTANEGDKSGNCPAGFVADRGLSSPVAFDFYLQSQGGLKGTSRPSHYIVLEDENFKNNVDDLQELAFALCHCYAKATRSVSIPAPVYYADLVCSRANFYFNPELNFADNTTDTSGSKQPFILQPWKDGYGKINKAVERKMYFL